LKLADLRINDNQFSGPIPAEFGTLSSLRSLWLGVNNLTGPIPPELGNLSELRSLWLGVNNLMGTIPSNLGNLEHLRELNLQDNQLSGSLPPELGNLLGLISLSLGNNQLVGQLPRTFMQLSLEGLDYRRNSGLCAPPDDEFQNWLALIEYVFADPNYSSSVSAEQEGLLPVAFTVQGNYPNPFRASTSLRFDLPWPASVGVEVSDITGRQVFLKSPVEVSSGRDREIYLNNLSLPSGTYLYRLTVNSSDGIFTHSGRFVLIQ